MALVVATFAVTLIVVRRARTGDWSAPNKDDLKAIQSGARRAVEHAKEKVLGETPGPSKVVFINGAGGELLAGTDDAPRGVSSILLSGTKSKVKVAKWSGSARSWGKLLACLKDQFKQFDVEVTDVRPATGDFMMAMVGGRARDIGSSSNHFGGLAPFNGEVIPRAIVFAFSRTLKNRVQTICETLAMEIAHAYGLDHSYYCPDVMTYRRGCGKKRFRDKDVPCGEKKKRVCKGGKATQNSVQRLLTVLGPKVLEPDEPGSKKRP